MPFKAELNKDFFIDNDSIKLSKEYIEKNKEKFKKITGSRFASILNKNKYTSPVKVWAMMTNIYFEEMDETLSKVGNVIEPKIKNYVEEVTKIKYKQYNPFHVKWDIFQENEIFGGIPDGEPINVNGEVDYSSKLPMLEIKTTSIDSFVYKMVDNVLKLQKDENDIPLVKLKNGKKESWYENGKIIIPDEYLLQLSLYLYLRKVNKGLFAIAFLEKEDYAHPEQFDCNKRKIELVEIDLNNQEFNPIITKAKEWYESFIKTGQSPKLSNDDKKWLKDNNILI